MGIALFFLKCKVKGGSLLSYLGFFLKPNMLIAVLCCLQKKYYSFYLGNTWNYKVAYYKVIPGSTREK